MSVTGYESKARLQGPAQSGVASMVLTENQADGRDDTLVGKQATTGTSDWPHRDISLYLGGNRDWDIFLEPKTGLSEFFGSSSLIKELWS